MKNKYFREIRHIVANYSIRNSSTGYPINSKSGTYRIIHDLVRHHLVECNKIEGHFLFVRPTPKLITLFKVTRVENKTFPVPSIDRDMARNNSILNLNPLSPVIVA